MRGIGLLVLVVAVATGVASVASAAQSPQAELAAMRSAMSSRHSVHYVSLNSQPGFNVRTVGDAGQAEGVQRMTVTYHGRTGPAEVRVVRRIAYLKGNQLTMIHFFGFLPYQAKKYANRWIFIPHSSPAYDPIAVGVMYPSFTAGLFPRTHLSVVPAGSLVGVRGIAHHTGSTIDETVFAPAHGKPLPVKRRSTFPGHPGSELLTMSHWNEAVHVGVPANAVPIEIVGG